MSFSSKLTELVENNNIDSSLDFIFEEFDNAFYNGNFNYVDKILYSIPVEYPSSILIGLLAAARAAKIYLNHYDMFYNRVRESLIKSGRDNVDELLKGFHD